MTGDADTHWDAYAKAQIVADRRTIDRLEAEVRDLQQVVGQQSARLEAQARTLAAGALALPGDVERYNDCARSGEPQCSCCYAVARVRELHSITEQINGVICGHARCAHCGLIYPCTTIRALDGGAE